MIRRIVTLSLALTPAACGSESSIEAAMVGEAVVQDASVAQAAASISGQELLRTVEVIAHDSMGGRDTPSPGLDATAEWIALELERLGLRGGAEGGGYVQRYPLTATAVDPASSTVRGGEVTLAYGVDAVPLRGGLEDVRRTAEVVLVSGSSRNMRAVAEEVAGHHAVLVPGVDEAGLTRAVVEQVLGLANAGAASVWVVTSVDDTDWTAAVAAAFAPSVEKGWGEEGVRLADAAPLLQVRRSSMRRLLGERTDLAALEARASERVRADRLPGLTVTLDHRVRVRTIEAPNVVGILDGSDSVLRTEYVVYSAHMDHIGMGAPDEAGDSVFNGADDDASGTAAILEVAEAMASLAEAPRRSSIFLWVSGEEKGLWGSEWYADHPSVPTHEIVANVNLDMVGRNWPDTIVVIGREHSDLGTTLDAVNTAHPELGMTAIDDIWPDARFYYRSDHFNFARQGVPVLFFFNGTHDDYHGLDDEPDRIDEDKAARIARLVFWLGIEIASRDERPAWDPASYETIVGVR